MFLIESFFLAAFFDSPHNVFFSVQPSSRKFRSLVYLSNLNLCDENNLLFRHHTSRFIFNIIFRSMSSLNVFPRQSCRETKSIKLNFTAGCFYRRVISSLFADEKQNVHYQGEKNKPSNHRRKLAHTRGYKKFVLIISSFETM